MDFNSISVSPNQLPNIMSMPPYLVPQYHEEDKEKQRLQLFWQKQLFNIQITEVFKSQQQLPLARIKRIMKADGDVQMVSGETPMLMAKACEIFIQELTLRAWMRAEENKKRTVQRWDIAKAIKQTEVFDFLSDIVPCDHEHCCAYHKDLVARNQQFPQPYMMQPPFVPSDQFPYNYHPK